MSRPRMRPRTRALRDPLMPREARTRARPLLAAAQRGDIEAASVLLDVLAYTARPELAESLALALQGREAEGRVYDTGTLENRHIAPGSIATEEYLVRRGDRLPAHLHSENLTSTLRRVERTLFPRRRRPCMPNRRAIETLFRSIYGPMPTAAERRELNRLWQALRRACNLDTMSAIDAAMSMANDTLQGHGVEMLPGTGARWGHLYINMGDVYNQTLFATLFERGTRFFVTTYADVFEAWQRRQAAGRAVQ